MRDPRDVEREAVGWPDTQKRLREIAMRHGLPAPHEGMEIVALFSVCLAAMLAEIDDRLPPRGDSSDV